MLFSYILASTRDFRKYLLGMVFCTIIIALENNIKPYIIKHIVDHVTTFNIYEFSFLAISFLCMQGLMIGANAIYDWLGTIFHSRYRAQTINKFFDHLSEYNYKFFQDTQSGSITSKISDAFNTIPVIVFIFIRVFLNFFLFIIIALAILSTISIYFVLSSVVWIAVFVSLAVFFYNKYSPINKDFAKVRPKIYGFLTDYFSNILSVYFFSNKEYERLKLQTLTSEFVHKSIKCGAFLRNYYALHGITVALYMFILIILLGYLASYNLVTPGDFVLVLLINLKIVDLLFETSNLSREFIANCAIVENAIEILDLPFIQQERKTLPAFMKNEMSIEFQNVSFQYNENKAVFDKLSIKIEPATKVALVGYSGGGKTSFVNIILRLYEIQSGKVLIGNSSLEDIGLKTLCNAISFIPQDPLLFHRSIIENIRYGDLNATDEEVINAAKKASAHDFINALTDGYNTVVGERGTKLSGGQRQRIAIARAILKNSPIFILDEATSQLDSITENSIRTNIHEIIQDKTALIVAHRLSTIVKMDRILVFDNGKIVQDGTYDQLLSEQGLFRELWEKQK